MEVKYMLKLVCISVLAFLSLTMMFYPVFALVGDVNGDGIVDGRDIIIVARAFLSYPGDPRWNPIADVNNDGFVDGRDIVLVARNFMAV
jgi:hypothetical protein